MELRQRKGGDSSIAVRAGEATGRVSNDGPEEGTPDDRQIVDDDASEATDAVVGAAVRGGSLLMLLALIQVRHETSSTERAWEACSYCSNACCFEWRLDFGR